MIADQMKKRCSPECKEHYLDIWEELISPEMLADKLEAFDNIRCSLPSGTRRHVKASETVPNERSPLRCCGKQGVIKSRCPTCNLNASQRTDVATNHINAYTAHTRSPRLTLIDITFYGIKGRVCADTGSSHSIAGERMFQIFKDKGLLFQETTLAMSLADGQQTTGEALTTQIEEVLLRYGIPHHLISDNGTQFVSAVMQQICYLLNIHQSLIPVYHPQANLVERKNRDLKPRLAILVQDKHDCWSEKLPFIHFALNRTDGSFSEFW
ncbi:uncharacterized protein TNCV_2828691 [Trichonephila clavipes]|nr:uncharacterized protein TNCV_2828691 [Trichonephila clavipes]